MALATLRRPFTLIKGGAPDPPEPELSKEEEAITVRALAGTCAHYWRAYRCLLAYGPLGDAYRPLGSYRLLRGILARQVGDELAQLMISERM